MNNKTLLGVSKVFALLSVIAATPATAGLISLAAVGMPGFLPPLVEGTDVASIPTASFNPSPTETVVFGATAVNGYLTKGTAAALSTTLIFPLPNSGSAMATADSLDVITPGGGPTGSAGFLDLDFLVSGSNVALLEGSPSIGTSEGASYSALQVCLQDPLEPQSVGCDAGDVSRFDAVEYHGVPVDFEFPIFFGEPIGLHIFMTSITGVTFDSNTVVNFSGSSDFSHTASLDLVRLLDANHQAIADPSLAAESGTIYPFAAGSPPSPPVSVPEPGSIALLVAGGLALCTVRRISRFRSRTGS